MRLHAARGEVDLAIGAARRAVESFSQSAFAVEAGSTLAAAAAVLLEGSRLTDADAWLHSADVVAEHCGSRRLADQVLGLRRRLADRERHPAFGGSFATLTEREREIAMLASTGMTSVEIARELYLSVRTVDGHLGRVYRKLDLSNRAGLTRAVLRPGTSGVDTPRRGLTLPS
jgi:DNA-binding CsgD family transcriptional regulator